MNVVELRQYKLHPGKREVLIELFESALIEPQEAAGMRILGQFRDLDRPDRFVWVRGFPDMSSRVKALSAFYGGPVWKAHREAANATMIDSDDVLLLRPREPRVDFPASRPEQSSTIVVATICPLSFEAEVAPLVTGAGGRPLAILETEPAENDYPALPVRTGENVVVWFSSFDGPEQFRVRSLPAPVQQLRLAPTARSFLR
jgi:hypothetical protein